jgi:hypothetical protein
MAPSVSFRRGEAFANLAARRVETVVASSEALRSSKPGIPKRLKTMAPRQLRSSDVEADFRLPIQELPANQPGAAVPTNTRVRRLPSPTSETATIAERGAPLTLDCKTLRCTEDWIGVRTQDERGRIVRGFVPRAQLETAELRIDYEGDATVPSSGSYRRLVDFIQKIPVPQRGAIDVKISARVLGDEAGGRREKREEYLRAIARMGVLAEQFKAARFGRVRIGDFFETQDLRTPAAVIELPGTPIVRDALQ